ncbi:MAG: saccharopine dehydrogenase C-terminal domain-containing protein [Chitinophagaceae bacterium]
MQQILILGAGKSATILIDHLIHSAATEDLFIHVADGQLTVAEAKIKGNPRAAAYAVDPNNEEELQNLIGKSDLVISMLPPPFHPMVMKACIAQKKHFLNASYLTPEMASWDAEAKQIGLTMLCEMGLDPGIDHMSAMEMIDGIRTKGGRITGFRSHCGGLISPESDNNPWHYKISWNPRNIVMAGSDGARYLEKGKDIYVPYEALFNPVQVVSVPGHGEWCWYANRDSIAYIATYGLTDVTDFVRTTLRHPDFCAGWKKVVDLELTNAKREINTTGMATRNFFDLHFHAHPQVKLDSGLLKNQFNFLGAESDEQLPAGVHSSVDIMQVLLEKKLALAPDDKDMIIMLHELQYELGGKTCETSAHLVVKGEDQQRTAMAKTVGLPLALAALAILKGHLRKPGVTIPVSADIYTQILPALEQCGIGFTYTN